MNEQCSDRRPRRSSIINPHVRRNRQLQRITVTYLLSRGTKTRLNISRQLQSKRVRADPLVQKLRSAAISRSVPWTSRPVDMTDLGFCESSKQGKPVKPPSSPAREYGSAISCRLKVFSHSDHFRWPLLTREIVFYIQLYSPSHGSKENIVN